jgi:hypothetical protein
MRLLLISLLVLACFNSVAQQPFRTWTNTKGTTMNARYLTTANGMVKLQARNGRLASIPIAQLIETDQAYLKSIRVPGTRPPAPATARPTPRGKATITNLKEEIQLGPTYFKVTHSDHFIILSTGRNGRNFAKNAEAVYAATAEILPKLDETFDNNGSPLQCAAILIEESDDYEAFLYWYIQDLQKRGQERAAQTTAALGTRVGKMGISLSDSDRETVGTDFQPIALFSPGGSRNGREDLDPFRTHVFAKQLLSIHAGNRLRLPFWLANGFGYRMEIVLCDQTRTHMLDYSKYESADEANSVGEIITSQSFADGSKWISILKKLMRSTRGQKGDIEAVLNADVANLTPERCGYMFALSHYILSDPGQQQKYASMIEYARSNGKAPDLNSLPGSFSFSSKEKMEEAWHSYLKGSKFR